MMSEALTIKIADDIAALAIEESGNVYKTVADRKVLPLFKQLDINLDKNNTEVFLQNLYKLLQANVFYCLLGDDSYYKLLLKKTSDGQPVPEGLVALDAYKKKYSQFFIQDYRWTENYYMQMVNQSDIMKRWYESVQRLNLKYDLKIMSIDAFKTRVGLTDLDAEREPRDLVQTLFDYVFENNVKRFFVNRTVNKISDNNLTKAFVRYMCNQVHIFERLAFFDKSSIYKNKIMNFLMQDTTTTLTLADIQSIRGFYRQYLQTCQEHHFITPDEAGTYEHIYSIVKPFYVNYDVEWPEPLDVVAKKICGRDNFS
jgi:hypothetical protein